jgi:hypothetical protein
MLNSNALRVATDGDEWPLVRDEIRRRRLTAAAIAVVHTCGDQLDPAIDSIVERGSFRSALRSSP